MSMRSRAALQAGLLLVATFATAVSKNVVRIKVLDSETHSVSLSGNGVPNDCDQVTFDAYCRSSRTAPLTNSLLVQVGDEPPFRIACTVDSKFSRCTPLPIGETFDAKREKGGITVYYIDGNGKARKQLYTLVASEAKPSLSAPAAAVASPPVAAPRAAAPVQPSQAAPTAATPAAAQSESPVKVKCDLTSTPAGAEITVDGKYVGNTPSQIALSPGAHVVAFNLSGFMEWKRDLTVEAGSGIVNVTAGLQKTQP
ncbi:MAG: PEGA domain-containing protein [Candidatus Sulfotelmatobacter sp.]